MKLNRLLAALGLLVAIQASAQERWVIGQSVPLSGGNAQFGTDIRDAAAAYFAMLNASGGIGGRKIELQSIDDKNDRKQAGINTTKLLGDKSLLALFGYGSATLSLDSLPQAEAAGVPFFAPFSGANAVRGNSPVLFTMRASYAEEMDKMLSFWTTLGMKRVSVVHYDDEVGRQNLAVVTQYLQKIKLTPTAFAIKRNAPVGADDVAVLYAQKPEVILNTVLSGAAAQIQKELAAHGRFVPSGVIAIFLISPLLNMATTASTRLLCLLRSTG